MPQQDAEASEADEAEEVLGVAIPAGRDAAVVEEPGEQPLDLPASPVAAQHPAVLGVRTLAVRAMRRDQLDSSLLAKARVERIAVVSTVSNKTIGCEAEKAGINRRFEELRLMRRSTRNPGGDRKTMAVCDRHDLCALAALGFPDGEAPFLAPAKVPSMKASVMSIPPRL
jgi:hypothetical protein